MSITISYNLSKKEHETNFNTVLADHGLLNVWYFYRKGDDKEGYLFNTVQQMYIYHAMEHQDWTKEYTRNTFCAWVKASVPAYIIELTHNYIDERKWKSDRASAEHAYWKQVTQPNDSSWINDVLSASQRPDLKGMPENPCNYFEWLRGKIGYDTDGKPLPKPSGEIIPAGTPRPGSILEKHWEAGMSTNQATKDNTPVRVSLSPP